MDGLPTDKLEKLILEWPKKPAAKMEMSKILAPGAPLPLIDLADSNASQKLTGN